MNLTPNEAKELIRNPIFKKVLEALAVKIRDTETIRNINLKDSSEEIGLNAKASYLAVEMVETWLQEIIGEIDFEKYKTANMEDDIFNIIDNEANNE